jgi:hypothetical protein
VNVSAERVGTDHSQQPEGQEEDEDKHQHFVSPFRQRSPFQSAPIFVELGSAFQLTSVPESLLPRQSGAGIFKQSASPLAGGRLVETQPTLNPVNAGPERIPRLVSHHAGNILPV